MDLFAPWHLFVIAIVLLLFFGHRLPSVMRSLGLGVVEFKKGLQGIEDDVKKSGNSNSNRIEQQSEKPRADQEAERSPSEAAPK